MKQLLWKCVFVWFTVALVAPPASATSPPPGWTVRNWTTRDGMAVNSVNAVLQGRNGFLWIASYDGLMRFDGMRFRVWDASNAKGLPSNRLTSMVEDAEGTLWLSTEQHRLVRFDGEVFRTFDVVAGDAESLLIALIRDSRGTIYAATQAGVARIEGGVPREIYRARGHLVESIHAHGEVVWIGTSDGEVLELRDGRIRRHGSFARGARVLAIRRLRDGTLYAGVGPQLVRLAGSTATLVGAQLAGNILSIDEDGSGTVRLVAGDRFYVVEGNVVRDVGRAAYPTRREHLSVRTRRHDVVTDTERLYLDGKAFFEPGSAITSVTTDDEGALWIGTAQSGLFQLRPSALHTTQPARDPNLYAVIQTPDGDVWIGGQAGGAARLAADLTPRETIDASRGVEGGIAWTIVRRRDGSLWIGGAGACRVENGICVRTGIDPGIGNEWVRALFEDSRGRLWIGAANGIYRFDENGWHVYRDIPGVSAAAIVRTFLEDGDGTIWMATNGAGILRYRDGRFTQLSTRDGLSSNEIRDLRRDGDVMWAGSENRGICRIDLSGVRPSIVCKDRNDGIYDSAIHRILDDGAGRFWISTNRGIFTVRIRDLHAFFNGTAPPPFYQAFTETDGMRNREANGGVQSAGTRLRDGRLAFPTQAGLVIADPRRLEPLPASIRIAVEEIQSRKTTPRVTPSIVLPLGDRELRIRYTGLSFADPSRLQFRYRLEGHDQEWYDAGTRREATFTNLPAGRFTFRVAARYPEHGWSSAVEQTVQIEVPPFFWETRPFHVAVAVCIAFTMWLAYTLRIRRANARAAELERRIAERTRQLQELGENRTRFFANVSHELRTPLTILAGGLEAAEETGVSPSRDEQAAMLRSARRLRRLVDQILDLEKIDAHAFRLQLADVDVGALVHRVAASFNAIAVRRSLRLQVDAAPLVWTVDAEQFERILANLLSNAIKFSPPGKVVAIALSLDAPAGEISIAVSDEGPGIPANVGTLVFERFYQVDGSEQRHHEGTGIGLSLVRELVELHGGSVSYENRPGRGSVFRVVLPRREPSPAGDPDESLVEDPNPLLVGLEETGAEERTTILVVDDNDDLRAHVRRILEPAYRILEARNGAEGLQIAVTELPDVILADVAMPVMNGLEMARRLRADPIAGAVPLIFLSARATETDQIRGLAIGGDEYIVKPFSGALLRARIAGLLRSRLRLRSEVAPPPQENVLAPAPESELAARTRLAVLDLIAEGEVSVQRLADRLAIDRTWLFRRLRDETGKTPAELIREVRLTRAAELLGRGNASVSEVAYAVGFASVAHFSRVFREFHGKSPSEWSGP